jgi:Glycosyl transferases group 1
MSQAPQFVVRSPRRLQVSLASAGDGRSLEPAKRVWVVSPMGLELSGLAITAERYADAISQAGFRADAIVVGNRDHREHGAAKRMASFSELLAVLSRDVKDAPLVFWTGLHTDCSAYVQQLETIRVLRDRGATNVVLTERTECTSAADYAGFMRLIDEGYVSGLVHQNEQTASNWAYLITVPQVVAQAPVPDGLFDTGRRRLLVHSSAEPEVAVIFIGRLTARKGVDRLVSHWPAWQRALRDAGHVPELHVFGQAFPDQSNDAATAPPIDWPTDGVFVRPNFPSAKEILKLPARTIGVSLSRQEFDGIAVSELLAFAIPVIATPTNGHRALAAESRGVVLEEDGDQFQKAILDLSITSQRYRHHATLGTRDISRTRSMNAAAQRLGEFLHGLQTPTTDMAVDACSTDL